MIVTGRAAVDPGKSGGIAVLTDRGFLDLLPMPDTSEKVVEVLQHIRLAGVKKLDLENIVLFNGTRRPGASMAVYASNFGVVKGAALALGFTMTLVSPQQWQSALGIKSAPGPRWKAQLAETARALFPDNKITLKTADAALLAAAMRKGIPDSLRCSQCQRHRPLAVFYKNARPGAPCKDCQKTTSRRCHLRHHYNLAESEYDALFAAQGGRCLICALQFESLNVDHSHTTREVRGLLCKKCNLGLGLFGDSKNLLTRAAEYLK